MRAFDRAVGRASTASATASTDAKAPPLPLRRAGQLASASPRPSRRTTCSASCSRCSRVTLSKDARARAVQLPAWNEALGLPRPWDQQWSLRMQQVLAYETDLLEYDDIFDGSAVIEAKIAELRRRRAQAEIDARRRRMGGAFAAVETGYMKGRLVASHAERAAPDRVRRARSWSASTASPTTEPIPLLGGDGAILKRRPGGRGASGRRRCRRWRAERDAGRGRRGARRAARRGRRRTSNMMAADDRAAPGPACTTGEWAGALREVFGEYRAPTGVAAPSASAGRRRAGGGRASRRATGDELGRPPAAPGRQARPRRPLQRRRADRRARPATPAWRSSTRASGSRPSRSPQSARRRGRRRGRPVDPVRLAPRARARGAAPACASAGLSTCRWWSAASSPRPTPGAARRRRRRGLHARRTTTPPW